METIFTGDRVRRAQVSMAAKTMVSFIDDPAARLRTRVRQLFSSPYSTLTEAAWREGYEDLIRDAAVGSAAIDPLVRHGVLQLMAVVALATGDGALLGSATLDNEELAMATDHPELIGWVPFFGMQLALVAGRLDDADGLADEM